MCVQNSEIVRTKMVEEFGDVSLALLTRFRKAGQEAFVPLGITAAEAMLLIFVERATNNLRS